ncbi:MAG: SPOR domain-containing protein [Xanthomonadaceae bacterium]|nr:SPOR domain-containing protein [Xanthomonadaceae bacterium]MDE2176967.1 SPOR domain-containing protein [Xanthomonadaceae bacterium]MDE2246756.1 SPOR domain-containing protein [Xanthomonadaceae bacterium]
MDAALKQRLIGFAVLAALAVIVVPMFFSGTPPTGSAKVSLGIPPAPDADLKTRTLDLAVPGSSSASAPTAADGSIQVPSDKLATVDLGGGSKPAEVLAAAPAPLPASVPPAPAKPAVSAAPAVPAPAAVAAAAAPKREAVARPKPAAAASPPWPVGTAAQGRFLVSLGAYADAGNARALAARVRALGFAVTMQPMQVGGKAATRVEAGPFGSRAAAEDARLRIKQAEPRAAVALLAAPASLTADAPGAASSADRADGWVVQLGAFGAEKDALALRNRLRAAGFAAYTDHVDGLSGQLLYRVRVGPQTRHEAALSLRDRIRAQLGLSGIVASFP